VAPGETLYGVIALAYVFMMLGGLVILFLVILPALRAVLAIGGGALGEFRNASRPRG
jgi:hypothetical protein